MDITHEFGLVGDYANHGRPVKISDTDATVWVGRLHSVEHREAIGRAYMDLEQDPMWADASDDEKQRRCERVAARALVKGWENFSLQGKPLPYSAENLAFMLDKYELFYELVQNEAGKQEMYRIKFQSEVVREAGNGSEEIIPTSEDAEDGSSEPSKRRDSQSQKSLKRASPAH